MDAQPKLLTTRLNHWGGNTLVLAKSYHGEPSAVTYANRTQATRKIESLKQQGVKCYLYGNQPFFVAIEEGK